MIHDLGPRLISHNEAQRDYYQRQLEAAGLALARVSLIYSGQLSFADLEAPADEDA